MLLYLVHIPCFLNKYLDLILIAEEVLQFHKKEQQKQVSTFLFIFAAQLIIELIMKTIPTISKIFAVLSLMSAAIWVGSYSSRLFLIYQLFEGPELILKSYINSENINGILTSIVPSIVVHFVAFIVMFITTLLFYFTSKIKLRFNGWLFIILIAIIITTPFEIYLMLIDYKIITMVNSGAFNSDIVTGLLRDRIKDLSSYSIVAILTYLSFYYFIVFQPLTKKD